MTKQHLRGISAGLLRVAAVACVLVFGAKAHGVDGVIEINQAVVDAAGGFPYVVPGRGSYRLTGNLVVSDPGMHAISIATGASGSTIDLNGFGIFGTGAAGAGNGINAPSVGILVVKNGVIRNVGNHGILANGGVFENLEIVESRTADGINLVTRGVVRQSRLIGNVGAGIRCGDKCEIIDNLLTANGGGGIVVTDDGLVSGNNSSQNTGNGIQVGTGGVVVNNVASRNTSAGILAGVGCTIDRNTVVSNTSAGIQTQASRVAHNATRQNGTQGVLCADSCIVSGNQVQNNNIGIQSFAGSLVHENVVSGNTSFGLSLAGGASADAYRDNQLRGNNGANPEVTATGLNLGGNVCNGAIVCP